MASVWDRYISEVDGLQYDSDPSLAAVPPNLFVLPGRTFKAMGGFVSSILGVTTSSVSSTTTIETKSLIGTVVGTFNILANTAAVGRAYRLRARGVITTGATASTITFQIKIGTVVVASTGAVAPTISQANRYWELDTDIIFRTIGASGSVFVQGKMHIMNAATPAAGVIWPIRGNSADPPAVVTIDTTADRLVDFQSITANNLHTITSNQSILERLN